MSSARRIQDDIAAVQAMIDGADTGLADYISERPYLNTAQDARNDLTTLLERLEQARTGQTVAHAQVLEDVEARRRSGRMQAAE